MIDQTIKRSLGQMMKGVQLVVSDLEKARAQLVDRGVEVSEIVRMNEQDGGSFVFFDDPDGNSWAVQEIKARATGGVAQRAAAPAGAETA